MTTRKPIVQVNGVLGELPSGDALGDYATKTGIETLTNKTFGNAVVMSNGLTVNSSSHSPASVASNSLQVTNEILSRGTLSGLFFEDRVLTVQSGANWFGWYATNGVIYLYNAGIGNIASIDSSTGNYAALSDGDKKKDFELLESGLPAIMALQPTYYRMNSEGEDAPKHLWFIAQDVKDVLPPAYVEIAGANGSDTFIGLDEKPIIAALVKAVQELKAELDAIKGTS